MLKKILNMQYEIHNYNYSLIIRIRLSLVEGIFIMFELLEGLMKIAHHTQYVYLEGIELVEQIRVTCSI